MSTGYRAIKIPGYVYIQLKRVRGELLMRGTDSLPEDLRGAATGITLGDVVSLALTSLDIAMGSRPTKPKKR